MPIVRDPLDPKISMWHFLAYYLRFLREKEGLSLTQWGRITGTARSSVSNMEAGRHRLQDDQAKRIDLALGTGGLVELLLWYARMAHNPEWGTQLLRYEEHASLIKTYHDQVIPLALQTDDYTRAYVYAGTPKDFEAELAERIARKQAFWDRGNDVEMWAVLDEGVLARVVGDTDVVAKQLEYLLEVAEAPQVSLRIIPFTSGAHLGADGALHILSLDARDVAYAGAQNCGRLIETPGEVRELSVKFERIGAKAASEEASREIIRNYRERYP